jgi:hypothetical protein
VVKSLPRVLGCFDIEKGGWMKIDWKFIGGFAIFGFYIIAILYFSIGSLSEKNKMTYSQINKIIELAEHGREAEQVKIKQDFFFRCLAAVPENINMAKDAAGWQQIVNQCYYQADKMWED